MDVDEFWALMRTLGPDPDDDDFARLTDDLATRSGEDIIAFEDRLAVLLHALDTPAHAAAARAGNDWFLYVRCAAVAAGRTTYEEVLAEPAALRRFARREAEFLLTVAPQAYERSTGMLWEHQSPIDYESGSNTAAWGEPEAEPFADRPEHTGPPPWLSMHATVFVSAGWPAAYPYLIDHIGYALADDPAWQGWWSTAGVPECQVSLFLQDSDDFGPPGTTVKVGRTRVEAHTVRQPASFTGTEPPDLLPQAVSDVTGVLNEVRARLDLGPLPPMQLPELPADLPRGIERPESLPEMVADLGPRNLLKALVFVLLGRFRRGRAAR